MKLYANIERSIVIEDFNLADKKAFILVNEISLEQSIALPHDFEHGEDVNESLIIEYGDDNKIAFLDIDASSYLM